MCFFFILRLLSFGLLCTGIISLGPILCHQTELGTEESQASVLSPTVNADFEGHNPPFMLTHLPDLGGALQDDGVIANEPRMNFAESGLCLGAWLPMVNCQIGLSGHSLYSSEVGDVCGAPGEALAQHLAFLLFPFFRLLQLNFMVQFLLSFSFLVFFFL